MRDFKNVTDYSVTATLLLIKYSEAHWYYKAQKFLNRYHLLEKNETMINRNYVGTSFIPTAGRCRHFITSSSFLFVLNIHSVTIIQPFCSYE